MNETNMCHLMIDIETLSSRNNAAIMSIGVVQFDLIGNTLDRFHEGIDLDSCIHAGLHIDGETVKWWLGQPKENIDKLLGVNPVNNLETALSRLETQFLSMRKETTYVWSHGSNFDLVVLENAYYAVNNRPWWKYKNVRDTRTLFDVANYSYKAKGGHDALEDARNQAKAVQEAYQQLTKGGNHGKD